jgi:hypothetical protein
MPPVGSRMAIMARPSRCASGRRNARVLQQTTSTAKTFLSYTLKDPLGSRTLDTVMLGYLASNALPNLSAVSSAV